MSKHSEAEWEAKYRDLLMEARELDLQVIRLSLENTETRREQIGLEHGWTATGHEAYLKSLEHQKARMDASRETEIAHFKRVADTLDRIAQVLDRLEI
jgi:hypothetical protein